jgi:hypothetical protein
MSKKKQITIHYPLGISPEECARIDLNCNVVLLLNEAMRRMAEDYRKLVKSGAVDVPTSDKQTAAQIACALLRTEADRLEPTAPGKRRKHRANVKNMLLFI